MPLTNGANLPQNPFGTACPGSAATPPRAYEVAVKNPGGLLFWATCANLVGPMYPPEQELKAPVEGPHEELVFGIIRRNLVGAFQFMTAKEVDITVYSPTRPIRINLDRRPRSRAHEFRSPDLSD